MADLSGWMPVISIVGVAVLLLFGIPIMLKKFYIKVEQGTALIINTLQAKPKVTFTGGWVFPVIYKKELMKISLITLEVDRRHYRCVLPSCE